MTDVPDGHRILVVEDDEDVLRMVYRLLSDLGNVAMARDGQAALDLMQRGGPPDLVVSDVLMPHLDGLEMTRQMRADPQLAKVPVIFLTARTGTKDLIEGINAGARHYLTKPFTPEALLGKVRKALGID